MPPARPPTPLHHRDERSSTMSLPHSTTRRVALGSLLTTALRLSARHPHAGDGPPGRVPWVDPPPPRVPAPAEGRIRALARRYFAALDRWRAFHAGPDDEWSEPEDDHLEALAAKESRRLVAELDAAGLAAVILGGRIFVTGSRALNDYE